MHFGEFCRRGFDYIVQSVYLRLGGWKQRWFTNLLIFLAGRPAAVLTRCWLSREEEHLIFTKLTRVSLNFTTVVPLSSLFLLFTLDLFFASAASTVHAEWDDPHL